MVKDIRRLVDKIDSAAWLNAVRNRAGSDYQNMVPEATQANLRDSIDNLWNNPALRNRVEVAFVEQLAMVQFVTNSFENPLAEFKIGMLEEGNVIEEIMVGLIDAVDYDENRDELEREIFGDADIEVQSRFHTRNRKDRFKFTLNLPGLRSALLGGQLNTYAGQVMASVQTSDQYAEFMLMMRVITEMDRSSDGGFYNVNVPDISDQSSDAADSRFILRRIREHSNTLPFISRAYNLAGMPVATRPEDLMLLVTAGADAAMDVEALAAAFQIDKIQANKRKIVIPAEHFGIDGSQVMLTTKNFFKVADNLMQTTSVFNPAKLTTNFWLHHWQTISGSPFAPVVMFNSRRESTVISQIIQPTTDIGPFTFTDRDGNVEATALTRGKLYSITVEGITTPVGGVSALDLKLEGKTSQMTFVNNNGTLYVAPDEDASTLTIIATAENGYNESTTRTLKGDLVVANGPDIIVIPDTDLDGLEEVTPVEPGFADNVITIPTVVGVQYKDGTTNLINGARITITANKTITAEARPGRELAANAPTSWNFVYTP